jgi:hypothetical protein
MPRVVKQLFFDGGVNRYDNARSIRDDQAYTLANLAPTGPRVIETRKVMQASAEVLSGPALDINSGVVPLAGIFPPRAVGTINLIVAYFTGTDLKFVGTVLGGSSYVSRTLAGPTLQRRPSLVYFNRKVYGLVGAPLTGRSAYVLAEDGSALGYSFSDFDFAGAQATRPIPSGMCGYRRRAVFWDLGSGYEDYIVFSDTDDPATVGTDILASNGRAFRAGARDAGRVIACREVMLNAVGSPAQSALLVLRERGAFLITGEPNQTTDTTDFLGDMNISRFNVDCGCVSAATVVETPEGVLWASEDDVWMFRVGQTPFKVGTHIRPELRAQNPSTRWLMHAEYYDGFYRLAVFDSNKVSTVSSPLDQQWWLDLRNGAPADHTQARWFGPHTFFPTKFSGVNPVQGTFCMFREGRSGQQDYLYGLHPAANATVYAINLVKYDQTGSEDYAALTTHAPTYKRHSNTVRPQIISKQMDFDDHGMEKIWTGLEVDVNCDRNVRLNVTNVIDGGDTTSDTSVDLTGDSAFDNDADADDCEQVLLYPDDSTRPLGRKHSLSISRESGYVIDSSNNKISIETGSGVTEYDLTEGWYENLEELLNMVVLKLIENIPTQNWTHNITSDPNARSQYVEILSDDLNWKPRGVGISSAAAAFWELIGFTSGGSWVFAFTQAADQEVLWEPCARMRFGGMLMAVNPIPRRPDGA